MWIAILFVVGCGPIREPKQSRYLLTTQLHVLHASPQSQFDILVSMPAADPGYRRSEIIYLNTPNELKAYANHHWVAPPSQMLLPILVASLERLGYFHSVVATPFVGVVQYRLDVKLLQLQQEFFTPVSRVKVLVKAIVINTLTQQVIGSRTFEKLVLAPGNNHSSGVAAASQGVAQIAHEIASFTRHCVSQLRRHRR